MPSNPFEERDVEPLIGLPEPLRRALEGGTRLILVRGACGLGKTTVLRSLRHHLSERGQTVTYVYLGRGEPAPAGGVPGWLLLDEAQRLAPAALLALAERQLAAGGLACGSHADHRRELAALGVEPVELHLRPLRDDAAVSAVLATWLPDPPPIQLDPAAIAALRRTGDGNPGLLLRLAYELAEDLPPGASVTPADIAAARRRLASEAPALLAWRRRHRTELRARPR